MSDLLTGIANFTKTVQNTLNSYEMRKIGDKVQGYVMNFTEAEAKVREATTEDPWGPTGPQMQELASMTLQYDVFSEIMGMLWKRMFHENKVAWRRVYKSLILLNYLLKNGSERVISVARDHTFKLRGLESYKCYDERGKDEGVNVRHRVKLVLELLQDDDMLRAERKKAKAEGREKYQGFSKEEMLYRGSKSSSFDSWNDKSLTTQKNYTDYNQREITAFDFEESRNHGASPELGIPDKNQENFDVDEFGEFSEARSTINTTKFSSPIQNINTSSIVRIPALPLPKHAKTTVKNHQNSTVENLFPLTDHKFSAVPNQDLFSNQNNVAKNSLSNKNNIPNDQPLIDDIFDTSFADLSNTTNTDLLNNQTQDLFDLPSQNVTNILNDFQTISTTQSLTNNSSITTSLFNSNFFNNPKEDLSKNSSLLLDDLDLNFLNTESKPSLTTTTSLTNTKSLTFTPISTSGNKLPKTWEDLKGKINMDFDNLSLRPQPTKVNPTLNELQEKKISDNL